MHVYDFISLLIVMTLTLGIIELFKIKKRTTLINFLFIYFFTAFIMFTIGNYKLLSIYIQNDNILKRKIFELINSIFSLFELLFFSTFLELHNNTKASNPILRKAPHFFAFLLLISFLYTSLYNVTESTITNIAVQFNILEFAFLLILCLRYFYFTIKNPIDSPITNKSALKIISALFLYISVSLPLLIISEKINKPYNVIYNNIYNAIYVTHYIVLLIVFISITVTLKKRKPIFYA
jgi:hypothetical protein